MIERGTTLLALEAKQKERPTTADLRGFTQLENYYGEPAILEKIILCTTKGRVQQADGLIADNGIQLDGLLLSKAPFR